jgi:hypothetical protein
MESLRARYMRSTIQGETLGVVMKRKAENPTDQKSPAHPKSSHPSRPKSPAMPAMMTRGWNSRGNLLR